jgi:hypothetical protein
MSDWKSDLDDFFQKKEVKNKTIEVQLEETKSKVINFFKEVVVHAFEELKTEMEKHQRDVKISSGTDSASIVVYINGEKEFDYSIKVRVHPQRAIPYPETRFRDRTDGKTYRAEGFLRSGSQDYSINDISKDEIIKHFLTDYKNQVSRT